VNGYLPPSIVVTPKAFEEHVRYLRRHFEIVPIGRIIELVANGRTPDHRWVALTFDDGYEDNYRVAFPILREHGATAAFYITTACVSDETILWGVRLRHAIWNTERTDLICPSLGHRPIDLSTEESRHRTTRWITGLVKSRGKTEADELLDEVFEECGVPVGQISRRIMMSWDEIREMRAAGMTIGAHTANHYNLTCLDDSDVTAEVEISKETIEAALGDRVDHFAYPNGRTDKHCDARVAGIVAKAGYESAVTSVNGPAGGRFSPYGVPRVGIATRRTGIAKFAADLQYTRLSRVVSPSIAEISAARNGAGRAARRSRAERE
jgi:peptidoglycan/xylan/chitin deacetylase (PgdA/CDA1 family)